MARMIGHDAYWGLCNCEDCRAFPDRKRIRRRAKRRERQKWEREVRNEGLRNHLM